MVFINKNIFSIDEVQLGITDDIIRQNVQSTINGENPNAHDSYSQLVSICQELHSVTGLSLFDEFIELFKCNPVFSGLEDFISNVEKVIGQTDGFSQSDKVRMKSIVCSQYLQIEMLKYRYRHRTLQLHGPFDFVIGDRKVITNFSEIHDVFIKEETKINQEILREISDVNDKKEHLDKTIDILDELREMIESDRIVKKIDKKISIIQRKLDRLPTDLTTDIELKKTEILKGHFDEFSLGDLPHVKVLDKSGQDKLLRLLVNNDAKYFVAMLNHLGVLDHLLDNYCRTKNEANIRIAKWRNPLAKSGREVRRHLNSITKKDYNDKSDAYLQVEIVRKDYETIKKGGTP
ncbi:hypothetical protein [Ulvibacterium sp.]|uniref:hypothetical protein n=1 Tax=Ulvibacterium sp. TaxID=2665914 RepID=UPI0026342FCD|nr:hypothetical protein [Ulvibacterium sp.]